MRIIVILLLLPSLCFAWSLPSDRSITWQGNVGVDTGIPARLTTVDCTQAPYNVPTNGSSSASASIQSCLNGISTGQTAYLPAGTYIITSTVSVPSNKTLRGAGMTSTILLSNSDIASIVSLGGDNGNGSLIGLTSGYTKGSTSIVASDASTLAIGDYVIISETNDATVPVTISGDGGECTFCGHWSESGTRARNQMVKITNKSGNTLTISPELIWTFGATRSPSVREISSVTEYAGLESLNVKNGTGTFNQTRNNVLMMNAANCWVKDVKTEVCGYACVRMWGGVYRSEVRNSYFTECIDDYNSGSCYGIPIQWGCSSNLVENNVWNRTSDGVIVSWGASGNVIGYNYLYKVHRTQNEDGWFWSDMWHHGAHPGFNLWEGNEFVGLNWDSYWGSSSNNIAFRNRILGKEQTLVYAGSLQNVAAIQIQNLSTTHTVVGNVLGTDAFHTSYEVKAASVGTDKPIYGTGTGGSSYYSTAFSTLLRHRNWDYYSDAVKDCDDAGEPGCQSGDTDSTLPNSLYLSGKPSWFGSIAWPPFNPIGPVTTDIPSKIYFNTGVWPSESGDTTPPTVSNPLPSGAQAYSANPQNVTLQVATNEASTCRMSTSNIAYASMTDTFTTTGSTAHSEVKSLAAGASYLYYVQCSDTSGNATSTPSQISFSIDAPPVVRRTYGSGTIPSLH